MKLSYLWRGLPGHPIHPPLTDATIGTYTFATVAALVEVLGITDDAGAYGWWIALILGLILTVPTALTGLADWLTLTWKSELWWTATYHMLAMVTATVWFALAAIFGHGAYSHGNVSKSTLYKMGMDESSPVLTRSITIMARRLSSRSSRTPAKGPKTSGGMVCKTPISDIFSAESVIA